MFCKLFLRLPCGVRQIEVVLEQGFLKGGMTLVNGHNTMHINCGFFFCPRRIGARA
jgi:hypothetical protein